MEAIKRRFVIRILLLGLIAAVFMMIPLGALAEDKPLKWKMGIIYTRVSSYAAVYHAFGENVKQMSGGRLQIEEVYNGEGVVGTEILGDVSSGLLEMGSPFMALHSGVLPAGLVELGLPGGPTDYLALQTLFLEWGWKEILTKAYATQNVHWLGTFYQPGVRLITKQPINSLSDLADKKIRGGGAYGKLLNFLGATTVVMDPNETYTSLVTGVIDGVDSGNMIDHRDRKWYEVSPYMYPLGITGSQMGSIIVNLDAWKKLPDDLKAILQTAMYKCSMEMAMKSYLWEKDALDEMLSKGLKMSPKPSDSDIKKWREAGQKTWEEYAAKDKFSNELLKLQGTFMKKFY